MSDQPMPTLVDNEQYRGFFEGLRNRILRARKCTECGTWQWPPQTYCATCQSTDFEWHDLPAQGIVYTYSVMFRAFRPYYQDLVPYGVVIVELGPVHISGRFVGDPESIECGMAVKVNWDELATDGASPAFHAAAH